MSYLGGVTMVVDDYDKAIHYFCDVLGFTLCEDTALSNGKRWVVIAPTLNLGATLLLAKASDGSQVDAIGNQTGGRVAFFLYTNSFDDDYSRMVTKGVDFIENPRIENYGKVVVFRDLYGNKWDFIGRSE